MRHPLPCPPRMMSATWVTCALLATVPEAAVSQRAFTPEIALDVRGVGIAAVSGDGTRVAATVRTRRDRADVDHGRYGDPTYISPVSTRLMVIDTRSGDDTWVEADPLPLRAFAWSPNGRELAYFAAVPTADGSGFDRYELRVFDAAGGGVTTVVIQTGRDIASSSPLVWSPDGGELLIGLRPEGWSEQARAAFHALTEAPVIVQDSRNDFLAWDRVRNLANQQETALISLADGSVRDILFDARPIAPAFSEDGSYITYSTATRTKTSYTRRDGTEYELFRLGLTAGSAPESLRNTGEERMNVTWNDARNAFAYSELDSVFVHRLGENGDTKTGIYIEPGDGPDSTDVDADSTRLRFSVQRWSPSGNQLLLSSQDAWHLFDLDSLNLRPLLELEEDEDVRPRRQIQGWSSDERHVYFSYSARDRWHRGLKRIDTSSGEVETLVLDANLYRSWNVSDDGNTIVYTMSDGDRPDEVWGGRWRLGNPAQAYRPEPATRRRVR